RTDARGRFRFVAVPGPVLVLAIAYREDHGPVYRPAKPDPKYPGHAPSLFGGQWCKVIEPKEGGPAVNVAIELEPAPRMTVKVVDAGGKPVTGTHATGITEVNFEHPVPYPGTDTLTVFNVERDQERLLA